MACYLRWGLGGIDALQWFNTLEIKVTFKSGWSIQVDFLIQKTDFVSEVRSQQELSDGVLISEAKLSWRNAPIKHIQGSKNK